MEAWTFNYKKALKNVMEFCKGNLHLLTQQIAVNYKDCDDKMHQPKTYFNYRNIPNTITTNPNNKTEGFEEKETRSGKDYVRIINKGNSDHEYRESYNEEIARENRNESNNTRESGGVDKENESNYINENEAFEIPNQNFIQLNNICNRNNTTKNTFTNEAFKNNLDNFKSKNLTNSIINNNNQEEDINNEPNIFTTRMKSFLLSEELEKQIMDLYLESEGFPIDMRVGYNLILILKYQDWFKDAYKCMETKKYSEKLNKKVLTNYKATFEKKNQTFIAEIFEEKELYEYVFRVAKNFFEKIYLKYLENMKNTSEFEPNKEKAEILQQLNSLIDTCPKMQGFPEYKKTQFIRKQVSTYYKLKDQIKGLLLESFNFETYKDIYDKMIVLNFQTLFIYKMKDVYENFHGMRCKEIRSLLFANEKRKNQDKNEKLKNNTNNNNKKYDENKLDYYDKSSINKIHNCYSNSNNDYINYNNLNFNENLKVKKCYNSGKKPIKSEKTEASITPEKKLDSQIHDTIQAACQRKDNNNNNKMLITDEQHSNLDYHNSKHDSIKLNNNNKSNLDEEKFVTDDVEMRIESQNE